MSAMISRRLERQDWRAKATKGVPPILNFMGGTPLVAEPATLFSTAAPTGGDQ